MKKALIGLAVMLLALSPFSCKKKSITGPSDTIDLAGRVLQNGQPFAGLKVYLSWDASRSTETDGTGSFGFIGLTPGDYVVTPSQQGYAFDPSNFEGGSETRHDLVFSARPATYGSVINEITANFTLKNQTGANVSLYDFFGRVILINFSADWCGPCREEAGHLEALYNEYKDKGFIILTLLISGNPKDWASQYGLTFPVLNDNARSQWNIYGEGAVPLNMVLDRNCTIRYKTAGYNETQIRAAISKHL